MQIIKYEPNFEAITARKSIKRFVSKDLVDPAIITPVPFQKPAEAVKKVANAPVATYKAPISFDFEHQSKVLSARVYNFPLEMDKHAVERFLIDNTKNENVSFSYICDKESRIFKGYIYCGFKTEKALKQFIKDVDGLIIDSYKIGAQVAKHF